MLLNQLRLLSTPYKQCNRTIKMPSLLIKRCEEFNNNYGKDTYLLILLRTCLYVQHKLLEACNLYN